MTIRTYSSPVNNASTSDFRAWGSELSSNLDTAGLALTSDTGQINWSTVTLPGPDTSGGYEIRTFPDSSLFLKIEYGNFSGGGGLPKLWFTVGEGSNGTGTLTGTVSNRVTAMDQLANINTVNAWPTYICVTNDFFGLIFKANNNDTNGYHLGVFMCGKTVDGNGNGTGVGYYTINQSFIGNGNSVNLYVLQCVRRTGNNPRIVINNNQQYCMAVGHLASGTLDDGSQQAYSAFGAFPETRPLAHICAVTRTEVSAGTTFQLAPVGTTQHTFLCIQASGGKDTLDVFDSASPTRYSPAMLWE